MSGNLRWRHTQSIHGAEIVNVEARELFREIPIKNFCHNALIKYKISFLKCRKGRETTHIHDTNWQMEFLWLDMYSHVKNCYAQTLFRSRLFSIRLQIPLQTSSREIILMNPSFIVISRTASRLFSLVSASSLLKKNKLFQTRRIPLARKAFGWRNWVDVVLRIEIERQDFLRMLPSFDQIGWKMPKLCTFFTFRLVG